MKNVLWMTVALVLANSAAPGWAQVSDKDAACMPLMQAGWAALVEVYDDVLSGKPKYEAAKRDPSKILIKMSQADWTVDTCTKAIGYYGFDGMKALAIKSMEADKAAGKRPRIFD